ncbi:unnamed protein product [Oppiella nova]|uniref:Protein kinase domain-containing protein n=1 Tax=Oppiella nova TaxID=334625 RepID=A0A7R9LXY5_9ACAR|nr:unnamed protein product [Oppiella nova]CAG2168078.1 unnamed protein product [Oppiella nova]
MAANCPGTYENIPISTGRLNANFVKQEEIGAGSFGTVYRVHQKLFNQALAVKEINMKNEKDLAKNVRELSVWFQLQSEYVVKYRNHWFEKNPDTFLTIYIIMDLCDHNLRHLLTVKSKRYNRQGDITRISDWEYLICYYLYQEVLIGVDYLHTHKPAIIHRDLKPSNILVAYTHDKLMIKLGDFGLATNHELDQSHTENVGTTKYVSPEIFRIRRYTTMVDMYSMGVICEEIFQIDSLGDDIVEDKDMLKDIGNDVHTNKNKISEFEKITLLHDGKLFIEILEAINYLHTKSTPIMHRSIQPSNILIIHHAHGRFVKLSDFGLAIEHHTESQSHTQFPNAGKYMAPEVKQSRKYGLSSDVYSVGVLAQDLFNFDINKFEYR